VNTVGVTNIVAKDRILKVLTLGHAVAVSEQHLEWERKTKGRNLKIVLLGAGPLAKKILSTQLRYLIQAIADNDHNVQGSEIDGFTVISPDQAIQRFGLDACFVVTIYNGSVPADKLRAAGCTMVIPFPIFFRYYAEELLPHVSLQASSPLFTEASEILLTLDLWADEESKSEFTSQIEFHGSPNYKHLPRMRNPAMTYFDSDLFELTGDDKFVDCGAFDGDVIKMFLSRIPAFEGIIIAFEPDKSNAKALADYVAGLSSELGARILIQPFALGNVREIRSFTEQGTVGSGFSSGGEGVDVQVVRLDEVLVGFSPTLIKMDIEGAEIEALQGGRETIARDKPILAICTYHHISDLWRIPQLIHDILPEYSLYLRRYAEDCWETVCYAIPPQCEVTR